MEKPISLILRAMSKAVDSPAAVSYNNPFKVLISTVLSQRTRDKNTILASTQLFEKYKTVEQIANAPLPELRALIRPAGFYREKAKRLKEISRTLLQDFGGKVPMDLETLILLPGVGRKTANCVLVYGFGKKAMPVDVHVHRISNRVGVVKTKEPEETEFALRKKIPEKYWLELNHLMVKYGQKVCLPRNPKCNLCEISTYCDFFLGKSRFK